MIFAEASLRSRHRARLAIFLAVATTVLGFSVSFYAYAGAKTVIGEFMEKYASVLTAVMGTMLGYYFGAAREDPATMRREHIPDNTVSLYEELLRSSERSLEMQKKILELEMELTKAREHDSAA